MITLQLAKGEHKGTVIFTGNGVAVPSEMTVTGGFTLQDIQALFWHITSTGEGHAQGIYELNDNVCAPYELLFVMKIYSIAVNGVPQEWLDEMASMARAVEQEFAEGSQS